MRFEPTTSQALKPQSPGSTKNRNWNQASRRGQSLSRDIVNRNLSGQILKLSLRDRPLGSSSHLIILVDCPAPLIARSVGKVWKSFEGLESHSKITQRQTKCNRTYHNYKVSRTMQNTPQDKTGLDMLGPRSSVGLNEGS